MLFSQSVLEEKYLWITGGLPGFRLHMLVILDELGKDLKTNADILVLLNNESILKVLTENAFDAINKHWERGDSDAPSTFSACALN